MGERLEWLWICSARKHSKHCLGGKILDYFDKNLTTNNLNINENENSELLAKVSMSFKLLKRFEKLK